MRTSRALILLLVLELAEAIRGVEGVDRCEGVEGVELIRMGVEGVKDLTGGDSAICCKADSRSRRSASRSRLKSILRSEGTIVILIDRRLRVGVPSSSFIVVEGTPFAEAGSRRERAYH